MATAPVSARHRRQPRREAAAQGDGEEPLFFDPERVPVEVIVVPNPQAETLVPEDYEVIGEKVSHRLARRHVEAG